MSVKRATNSRLNTQLTANAWCWLLSVEAAKIKQTNILLLAERGVRASLGAVPADTAQLRECQSGSFPALK